MSDKNFRVRHGLEVDGDATISGNLTVNGGTTTIESTTLVVDDPNIVLGKDNTTNAQADGGGITVKGATDKTLTYDNAVARWTTNIGLEVGGRLSTDATYGLAVSENQFETGTVSAFVVGGTTGDASLYGDMYLGGGAAGQSDLIMNARTTGAPSQNATISVERGSEPYNARLRWNEGADKWQQTRTNNVYYDIPISTDELAEGSTNQYYLDSRARSALSGGTGVTYSTVTGQISIGQAVGTTDNPTFAGATLGAVTVGIDTDQTISTSSGNLILQTALGTNSGSMTLTAGLNGNITLAPNGTGRTAVTQLSTTSPRITTSIDDTNGNELLLLTATASAVNEITLANAATGLNPSLTASGADTNVGLNIVAKGSGDIALTLNNGGNLTNTRNYVMGTIRDTTTDTNGDAWSFISGTSVGFRGISIDNSATTTKRPSITMRSFSSGGTAVSPRMALITEGSRGTPASPSAIQTNDLVGEWLGTGRTTTGWVSDLVASVPAAQTYYATEAWTALTNTGTGWAISLQPTATTLTAASRITVIDANPQAINTRSDGFNIKSKANTNLVTVDSDGRLQVFNTNATNPNNIYGYSTKVFVSTTESALGNNITIKPGKLTGVSGYDKQTELSVVQNTTDGTNFASYEMKTQRYSGTTYSPTNLGDSLGRLLFNGNNTTGASPAISQPGAQFSVQATETWTGSVAGTKAVLTITKTGTNSNLAVADFASTATTFKTDSYVFDDSTGADYLTIDANKLVSSKVVKTKITSTSIAQGSTYTPPATALNSIIVEITAGSGTTTIDVSNLTVSGENGVYDILVYNNTGGSINANGFQIVNGGNTVLDHAATITNGSRAIFEINAIDIYATAQFVANAV